VCVCVCVCFFVFFFFFLRGGEGGGCVVWWLGAHSYSSSNKYSDAA
jgi:hypothetical protein